MIMKFFKTVLIEITPEEALHIANPKYPSTIAERFGNENAECEYCKSTTWILLPREPQQKQYIQCKSCGFIYHL